MEKIEHFSHKHPLALKEKPKNDGGQALCSGCEEPISGPCYCCTHCNYVLHKSCAALPRQMNHPLHPQHPLFLHSSSPYLGRYLCDACKRGRYNFVYHCSLCNYDLDMTCACASLSTPAPSQEEIIDHSDHLLEPYDYEGTQADPPKHFRPHHAALVLVEEQSPQYADKLCDACVGPITPPLFACVKNCGFLLHPSCVQLPRTKQHRFHPHPLTLFSKAAHYDGIYRCDSCKSLSNGFVYRCDECQFDLDVCCGLLQDTIKHESHKHSLVLEKSSTARLCKGCNLRSKHVLVCDVCDEFAIDSRCATLPSTAWHMYDKHPLRLTYGDVEDHHLGEHNCGICKEKMSSMEWFYDCDDCDFAAHTCCVVGKSRRVKFGGSFRYDNHSHPLTFVEEIREQRGCDACGEGIGIGCAGWALKCGECKFWMHREGDCFWEQFKKSEKYSTLSGTVRDKYAANVLAATPNVSIK